MKPPPIEEVKRITARLRDPETGCPWDRAQTHESLTKYLMEETHEVIDAVSAGPDELKDELGDLLFQVLIHCQIASESGHFDFDAVAAGLAEKLVRRHPHVFGDERAKDVNEALRHWSDSKAEEKKRVGGLLGGVPRSLPALLRAQRVSEKAAAVGFEWDTLEGIRDQILDEVREFVAETAAAAPDADAVEDEFGDVLFSLVQLARRTGVDAEKALGRSCAKFVGRFGHMEANAGKPLGELTLSEFARLWSDAKKAAV